MNWPSVNIMRTNFICATILASIPFLICTNTIAEPNNLYNIEVIVFKYKNADYFKTETWDLDWQYPDLSTSIDFQRAPPNQDPALMAKLGKLRQRNLKGFKSLPASAKTLSKKVEALDKSSHYQLLGYYLWQQPGLAMDEAISIRINGGNRYNNRLLQTPNSIVLNNGTIDPSQVPDNYELDGSITLVMSRFLHIYTDLLFLQPIKQITDQQHPALPAGFVSKAAIPQTPFQLELTHNLDPYAKLLGIPINHHRRMRSGELHHLDHPMLGILIKATRS